MFDASLRPYIDPPLACIARSVNRFGISANTITISALVPGLLAAYSITQGAFWSAFALILLNRFLDGLDGAIARLTHPSDLGGYLDIVCDFIFYASIPLGFALYAPTTHALPAAFLLFSFIGTGCSFLAYAILAEKRQVTTDIRGKKSFYYLGGLTEGAETIGLFLICCIWHTQFPVFAWIFGILCLVTTLTRIMAAVTTFKE